MLCALVSRFVLWFHALCFGFTLCALVSRFVLWFHTFQGLFTEAEVDRMWESALQVLRPLLSRELENMDNASQIYLVTDFFGLFKQVLLLFFSNPSWID
jgi:hypothetical protein